MKKFIFILLASISFNISSAQSSINDYKYIIVEDQFNFQNEPGQYNLNRLVQFLLNKHGFNAIIEGQELPADLKSNFCLALRADVIAKGALRTKATIVLKDCESNEVYRSEEGVTKEKDFARAYDLAIRKASNSFQALNYAYIPNQDVIDKGRPEEVTEVVEEAKKEIDQLKAEIKELKEKNEPKPTIEVEELTEVAKVTKTEKVETVEAQPEATTSNWYDSLQAYKHNSLTYYKKPGYAGTYFVNQKDEVIFKLQNTTRPHVFILTAGEFQGVAFYDKDMKDYTFQYYEKRELKTKILKPN